MTLQTPLKPKDYASDQEVRWCPGCGNYSVIKAVQKVLADAGSDPAETVFVSGIGCSSRFPYYMETYGFHTIHGRAAAVATGVKLANPKLDVWVVSGDGDSLAIGGNHLLHVLRRNVDMTYLLLNNEIYGLTKGQASPTSKVGLKTPTSPRGTLDEPVHPLRFAIGAGARFVARGVDTTQGMLLETIKRAHAYHGAAFVEVLQNCLVFNDGSFDDVAEKSVIADRQLQLVHGQPMIFGRERNRGIRFNTGTLALDMVTIGENGVTEADILVHDENNRAIATMLADLDTTVFPLPVGVLYAHPEASFADKLEPVEHDAPTLLQRLDKALRSGNTWHVA